ncbi:Mitochondrial intermediate peptidase [Pleurotus pulmonarius]
MLAAPPVRDALFKSTKALFRFRGCLVAKQNSRRYISASSRTLARTTTTPLPPSPDDQALVAVFDQPSSSTFKKPLFLTSSGLFGHGVLAHPRGLITLAEATLVRAQILTNRILRARQSRDELMKVVKNLDRLSDMLCSVIDLAELVRNAHPDHAWVDAANEAYETLCEFMNVLNTHVGLYEVLKAVLSDPSIVKSLGPEAYSTAQIFWNDFEKSAINLPPEQRNRFVSLSSEILVLGREFLREANTARPPAAIKPSELDGLKDKGMGVRLQLQAQFTQRDLMVYPDSLQAQMIMRSAPAEEPRRKLYIAANSSTPQQIELLERLLRARGELAQLVGKESFAHMTLGDKMAKSPENVNYFLNALMDYTRPYARSALRTLSTRKQAHLHTPPFPVIQAWDRDFYCPPEPPAPPIPLPPLTLGTVFAGLSRLFRHLYGISFRPADSAYGETWHSDVHKLEVVDEESGVIGWVYADLFARRGKAGGAAHYTVRCSRRTDDDDEVGDGSYEVAEPHVKVSREFEAAKRHRVRGKDGVYQLPLVVLLCGFARPSSSSGPTVLEWHDVLTLFHEMGHAMHSMIGRTEYQNVSGTRCATDFVELPSILMEHFLNSPTVLSLFDMSPSTSLSSTLQHAGNHHQDPCHAIDTYSQILLASLDQIYHSPSVLSPSFQSTSALASLHNTQGLIPYVPGTSFQTQFGHLFGYGATYYSYLFDRAIASRVWRNVFERDPLNRELGEKYKSEVLRFGGGKDPWKMVSVLLDSPQLETGDADAMKEVGQWRIEDEVGLPGRH